MRGGHLSNPDVARLLKPFIVASWHGAGVSQMPDDVRQIYESSEIPKNTNVYVFLLDRRGQLVHSFHGLQDRRTGASYSQEIKKARTLLNLPEMPTTPAEQKLDIRLPDLEKTTSGLPSGIRMFVRRRERPNNKQLVVEVVAMNPQEWKVLSLPPKPTTIEPQALKNCLVQMYPPAIRAADQKKPFTKITGSLTLEPVGADAERHYAVLRGDVNLAKGDDRESAFQGTLEAVLTYKNNASEVESLRGIVAGEYLYRIRGTEKIPLIAAIESRPEAPSGNK